MLGVFKRGFLLPLILSSAGAYAQADRHAREVFDRQEVNGQAVYFAEEVKLEKNERLIFEEPARFYVKDLELEEFSEIDTQGNSLEIFVEERLDSEKGVLNVSPIIQDTSGEDGQSGDHGEKALDGLKGTGGAHGGDGSDGSSGADAADISIITPYLYGDVILMAKGGNGGRGGMGGSGGKGGAGLSGMDARILYRFRGLDNLPLETLISIGTAIGVPVVGQVLAILQIFNGLTIGDGFDGFDGGKGGNAGKGGKGGDGGNGGNIELIYASRVQDGKIYVNTRGGSAGAGGRAGVPGIGGPGGVGGKAGDIWARDGKPGNPGEVGATALAGLPGKSGKSGKIKVVETGDAEWLKCYVRYRQMLDLTSDPILAQEILISCLQ